MKQEKTINKSRQNAPVAPVTGIVTVDYPQEGEAIVGNSYTFRISAPENAEKVEVRINRESWQSCRRDGGYWWHDWSGFVPGKYAIMASIAIENGETQTSPLRKFQVTKSI